MSQVTFMSTATPPTSTPVIFSAQQLGNTPAIPTDEETATGTYLLGSLAILTELFDTANAVFPGDGISLPATFTAPQTGYYYLAMTAQPVQANDPAILTYNFQINTPARNYIGAFISDAQNPKYVTYSVVANLTATDIVTFQVTVVGQVAGAPPFFEFAVNGGVNTQTSISGFLIT